MWQLLRTMRHKPPGRAAKGNRRDTFNAALEQAEQLFAAAETTGAASRPMLIFYGTSQLGRAISAASTMLGNEEYKLSGHGINDGPLEGAAMHGLARFSSKVGRAVHFQRSRERLPLTQCNGNVDSAISGV